MVVQDETCRTADMACRCAMKADSSLSPHGEFDALTNMLEEYECGFLSDPSACFMAFRDQAIHPNFFTETGFIKGCDFEENGPFFFAQGADLHWKRFGV
ncbi:MAG TPA: hypothetical protein VLY20_00930 [Nitrospiria bacterium]|nr:hypothetical protein [Nitrospiria bacterium]